ESRDVIRMNRADGTRLALADGDRIRVSNSRGEMTTSVKLVERVPQGTVWFPDHFAQEATKLFDCATDPVTKVPAFRTVAVTISKVS
ncbi:MAG TPA: molybdopterin dinucleotide binding domain-containing protein, partial [Nitrospira sp.]|nr:molybdopterin dinucleotide binding domain-containing protein [Nitrospira sp.]